MIEPIIFLIILATFILFISFIIAFGYFSIICISSKFRRKNISLKIILESFGFGVVFFISYSYLIEIFYNYNIFSIFFPIFIFIPSSFLYWYKRDKDFRAKIKFSILKTKFQTFLEKKIWKRAVFVIFIFILQSLIQLSIERYINLPYKDPFLWFKGAMRLKFYGNLDFEVIKGMPGGFLFFVVGPLLFIDDYVVCYYYFKFFPMFLMYINILVIYEVSSKIFKKIEYVIFTLIIFLCFRYLFSRYILSVPSILGTNLGFIFLLTFEDKDNFFKYFERGAILGGIFLCHTLYGVFYIAVFLLFEIWNLITTARRESMDNQKYKFRNLMISFLKRNLIIIGFFICFSFLYILSLLIEGIDIISTYTYTIEKSQLSLDNNHLNDVGEFNKSILLKLIDDPDNFKNPIGFLSYIHRNFLNQTLTFTTLILFFAYFLNFNKNNKFSLESKNIVSFAKFTFTTVFLIFILAGLIYGFEIPVIHPIAAVTLRYESRLFELFQGFWSITFCLIIKEFIIYLNQLKMKYNKKKHPTKRINDSSNKKHSKAIMLSVLIGLGSYMYIEHLISHHIWSYYSYYDDDELGDIVLYAGDYFNEKYGHEKKNDINLLLFDNVEPENIFWLLTIYEYIDANDSYTYDDTSYEELSENIDYNEADYVISPKYELKSAAVKEIKDEYSVVYENRRYIFYKV